MSIVGFLLGWTGLPKWATELVALGVVAGGVLLAYGIWHHRVYVSGIAAQQAADQKVSAAALASAAAATRAAQDAANRAEESYREEIARNTAAAAAHPLGPVRLCIDAHLSDSSLSKTTPAVSGTPSASPPSGSIRGLPAGNPVVRGRESPDISRLLESLNRRADQVSAELRECKARP